ncbi:MAG TPA: RDD family protein [Myxococcota bacterium]|nr:RDD family protein [Myxococcota bacterium]HRY96671.1 RDD family protein [Myxococcota bacterium]HSA23642.1 RDD family protein [Myxococcota bacterium]
MICPHCAFPNEDGSSTCAKCRRPMQDPAPAAPRVTLPGPVPPPAARPVAPETPVAVSADAEVREVLAEAEIKEASGDLRAAFLACQAMVIDRFGSLEEEHLVALYLVMGRVSLRQGKWERARKYLVKAHSLRPGAAGLAELMAETERQSSSAPPAAAPPPAAASEPDDAFETPEEPRPGSIGLVAEPAPAEPVPPEPVPPRPGPAGSAAAAPGAPRPVAAPPLPVAGPASTQAGAGRLVYSAGFWRRGLALAVDFVLLLGLQLAMVALGSALLGPGPAAALTALVGDPVNLGVVLGLFVALLLTYLTVFARFGGQTVGKMLLGLRVVRLDGRSLGTGQALRRLAGMLLAALPGLAGFLWAAFDLERRGWHDRLGGTLVVRIRPPRAALATPVAGEG